MATFFFKTATSRAENVEVTWNWLTHKHQLTSLPLPPTNLFLALHGKQCHKL